MSERVKVVITRSKWASADRLRAWNLVNDENLVAALLIPNNGMMCCLGFVCQSLGVSDDAMEGVGMPIDLDGEDYPAWLSDVEDDAAALNDKKTIEDPERELRFKELFAAKTPIDLEFVP